MKSLVIRSIGAAAVAAVATGATLPAFAMPTVENLTAKQRYPWNNLVDVSYTVGGMIEDGTKYKLTFAYVTDGGKTTNAISSIRRTVTETGDYTALWEAPAGVHERGCKFLATCEPVVGDVHYMIVDLDTGDIEYEDYKTVEAALAVFNAAANAETYKDKKMVLRKVPVGTYTIGDTTNYSSGNSSKEWNLENYNDGKTYYIGIFPITQAQYKRITGASPSGKTGRGVSGTLSYDDTVAYRPVEQVSWNQVRDSSTGSAIVLGNVAANARGTFLQRLNAKTQSGNQGITGFDLPTEVMFEVAERAGATTECWWGSLSENVQQPDGRWYTINKSNSGSQTVEVGKTIPNAWGLYDMTGNVWERCLDTADLSSLAGATDPYTAASGSASSRRIRGGGHFNGGPLHAHFRASYRSNIPASNSDVYYGFRVAILEQ